jgi:signal transduction histidine kinase
VTHIDDLETANSDLQKANENLKATQIQLVQSEKMASMGRLVAGVAHELNNPIGAIHSSNDTLKSGIEKLENLFTAEGESLASTTQLKKLLNVIKDIHRVISDGTLRVAHILKRMRSFVRLDEAELQRVNVQEILENTIDMFKHELTPSVTIKTDFSNLPPITCYPAKLNQLFLQLLNNANQASREGGEITVRDSITEKHIVINVIDNGVGVSPEHLDKLFEPGFTAWDVGVGVGLGLPICHSIVMEHNGEIDIESELGKGTTVTVKLPRN